MIRGGGERDVERTCERGERKLQEIPGGVAMVGMMVEGCWGGGVHLSNVTFHK